MTLYAYVLCGLAMGLVTRLVLPASRGVGLVASALLGAVGGLLGAMMGAILFPRILTTPVHPLGVVLAGGVAALISGGVILRSRSRPLT